MEIVFDMYQPKHFSLELLKHQPVFRRQNLNFLGGALGRKHILRQHSKQLTTKQNDLRRQFVTVVRFPDTVMCFENFTEADLFRKSV